MKKLKYDPRTLIKNLGLVVLGTLILSFGTSIFLLPFNLVTGGISGIALIISNVISVEWLTVDLIVTILTWGFFLLGLIVLGKSFAAKTLVSTIIYPLGVSLFMHLGSADVLGGFFDLSNHPHSELTLIIATVASGICVGVGCALSFLGGGSTGGVDIISFVICKAFKRMKHSVIMFIIDASIIVLGMFIIGDFVISLLGITSAFIAAYMIDKVFLGGSKAFIANIVTNKYEEISQLIITEIDRTTTILDVTGGYSGKPRKMVMVSFTMRQYADIMNVINKIDKDAFITIHKAHEINGEGWTR
jgi:uncharacterized membrane-anchored protein YitT (DUF2179 family)